MYHAVLDGGEAGFDLIVNLFGNSVGGKEGQAAVGGDFYINVEAMCIRDRLPNWRVRSRSSRSTPSWA